ncbi:MAG: hypothetical protein AAF570_01070, partial [Bacteroidota bacterium]
MKRISLYIALSLAALLSWSGSVQAGGGFIAWNDDFTKIVNITHPDSTHFVAINFQHYDGALWKSSSMPMLANAQHDPNFNPGNSPETGIVIGLDEHWEALSEGAELTDIGDNFPVLIPNDYPNATGNLWPAHSLDFGMAYAFGRGKRAIPKSRLCAGHKFPVAFG